MSCAALMDGSKLIVQANARRCWFDDAVVVAENDSAVVEIILLQACHADRREQPCGGIMALTADGKHFSGLALPSDVVVTVMIQLLETVGNIGDDPPRPRGGCRGGREGRTVAALLVGLLEGVSGR